MKLIMKLYATLVDRERYNIKKDSMILFDHKHVNIGETQNLENTLIHYNVLMYIVLGSYNDLKSEQCKSSKIQIPGSLKSKS